MRQVWQAVPDVPRRKRRPKTFLRRSPKSQLKRKFSDGLPNDPRLPFLWLRRHGLAESLARGMIAAAVVAGVAPFLILFEMAVGTDFGCPHPDGQLLAPSVAIGIGTFVNALVLSNALTKAEFEGWVENDEVNRPFDRLGNRVAGYSFVLSYRDDPLGYRRYIAAAVAFGMAFILSGLFMIFGVRY